MIRKRAVLLAALPLAILLSAVQFSHAQVRFDVDDRAASDAANTEPGFEQFLIEGMENEDQATTTRTIGGVDVTISHSNSAVNLYGDRRREEPTNAGDFTEQELLRDFLFARGTTPDDGLDILLSNLTPQGVYDVRIWSYDTASNGQRVSDWRANGILVQDDYVFDGNDVPPDPVDNDVYAFDFLFPADDQGNLLIEGRWQGGSCCGVFLNAMSVELSEDIILGDFTGDGQINEDDFNRMADNMYGHLDGISGHENGDITFDGLIDLNDFHQFAEDFPAVVAAVHAVPEPASWVVGVLSLLGVLAIRYRMRRA